MKLIATPFNTLGQIIIPNGNLQVDEPEPKRRHREQDKSNGDQHAIRHLANDSPDQKSRDQRAEAARAQGVSALQRGITHDRLQKNRQRRRGAVKDTAQAGDEHNAGDEVAIFQDAQNSRWGSRCAIPAR